MWDIANRRVAMHIPSAHKGIATSLTFSPDGAAFFSCGKDQTVKMWTTQTSVQTRSHAAHIKPVAEYLGEANFDCISHHERKSEFVTAGIKCAPPTHSPMHQD